MKTAAGLIAPRKGRRPAHGLIVGMRHGHLEVVELVGARCRVRCECGVERVVFGSSLGWHRKSGQVGRCSKQCPMPVAVAVAPKRERTDESIARNFLTQLRASARKRSLTMSLRVEDVVRMRIGQACHYCGGSLTDTAPGLDRVDNAKGYTTDNVVVCCEPCNWARGGLLTYEEFVAAMNVRVARTGWGNAWPESQGRRKRMSSKSSKLAATRARMRAP